MPRPTKSAETNPRKKLYIYPNERAKAVARRALDRRKDLPRSKRGGLDAIQAHEEGVGSGVMRARDIASGKRVNAYQVKAFFDRHRGNYVKAKADGKKWGDSKAWQAWDLWGGEPLRKQVESAVAKDKRSSNPSKADKMSKPMANRTTAPKEKPYTIYLVQDKPAGYVLYSFASRDLISPSASASEYAWLLGESALEESGTHIFTSEAKLKRFLRRANKRIVRGRTRYPNPRNSKVKDALASEAVRFKNFNDFSNAYWDSCSRGLYWFPTNEKRFHIGLEERKRIKAGTFTVFCSPTLALAGRNDNKKYVAELDVTKLPPGSIEVIKGSGGSKIKLVASPGSVKVMRVLDAAKAKKAFKWQLSILPSSKEELRSIWEKAWNKRKQDAEKSRIRKEKLLERETRRAETRAKEDAAAEIRLLKRARRKAETEKKKRVSRSKASHARKKSEQKTRVAEEVKRRAAKARKKAPKPASSTASKKKSSSKKKATKKKASKKKQSGKWVRTGVTQTNPSPTKTRKVRVNVNKPGR
jgi:hypothetical protein